MSKGLFIPKKLKIGFQKRDNTLNGNLAYVIYFDEKGKLRKENSWQSWRDDKIEPMEVDNIPRSGYVVNRGVTHFSYSSFGSDRFRVRVYSPDGFEFEIYPENFMAIVAVADISKQYIDQECVFAWDGQELVLLPTNTEQYQKSIEHTEKVLGQKDKLKEQKKIQKEAGNSIYKFGNLFETKSGIFMYWKNEEIVTENKIKNLKKSDLIFDENGKVSLNLIPEKKNLAFLIAHTMESLMNEDLNYMTDMSYGLQTLPLDSIFIGKTIEDFENFYKNKTVENQVKKLINASTDTSDYDSLIHKDVNWRVKSKTNGYYSYNRDRVIDGVISKWLRSDNVKDFSHVFLSNDDYLYRINITGKNNENGVDVKLFKIRKDEEVLVKESTVKKTYGAWYDTDVDNILNVMKDIKQCQREMKNFKNYEETVGFKI